MCRWAKPLLASPFVLTALSFAVPLRAQLPDRLKACAYPSLADEIDELRPTTEIRARIAAEPDANAKAEETTQTSRRRVTLDSVKFEPATHMPDSLLDPLVASIKRRRYYTDFNWTELIAEVDIRGLWQNQGYFKVNVRAEAQSLGGDSASQHFALTLHVDEGLQYRMGRLEIRNSDPKKSLSIKQEQLESMFPLKQGDIFAVDKVRKAIEDYTKIYSERGYIDFTATPKIEAHDDTEVVDLTFDFDEQKQFRVGNVEVVTLDPKLEGLVKSIIETGDVYSPRLVDDFYRENKGSLPPDVSLAENPRVRRNQQQGTVELSFDFFTCP